MSADIQATVAPRKPAIVVTVAKPEEIPAQLIPLLVVGAESTHFVWDQKTASPSWDIAHLLDRFPSVTVVGIDEIEVRADVRYIDSNTIRVSFAQPFSGKAYLN